MSLTIKHLNADATFLITLNPPRISSPATTDGTTAAFSILIDPWLHSDAPVFHPRFSNQIHTITPAIASLAELSPPANLILISQSKSDHCHEGTLKEFEWSTHLDTRLYACPNAGSIIKSWKWFPHSRMDVFKKGESVRVNIPNPQNPELKAWVELEFMPAKWPWEMPSLHTAIGIKYFFTEAQSTTKVISALFTPHGVPISALRPWLAQLPGNKPQLSLLLHPFTHIYSILGGTISSGFPAGMEICKAANVDTWVSTHDEVKVVDGLVSTRLTETKWDYKKVEKDLLAAGIKNVKAIELDVAGTFEVYEGVVVNV